MTVNTPDRNRRSHRSAGLTSQAIAEAGLSIVRAGGTDALTMRALAERLSVRAPSLYHHVPNRDALLDLVAAEAFEAAPGLQSRWDEVSTVDQWNAATVGASHWARDFYHRHRGLATHIYRMRPDHPSYDHAIRTVRRGEVTSLHRLGVLRAEAELLSRVQSIWALSMIVAEEQADHRAADSDELWNQGLELLAAGLQVRINRALTSPATRSRQPR